MNNNVQRLPDNDYYQYFSYSLKSKVSYEKWNDPVSSLNHTAGFKKFSDLQVESKLTQPNSLRVGIKTDVSLTIELTGYGDLNSVINYDLATEPIGRENAMNLIKNNYAVSESRFIIDYYRFSSDWRMLFGGGETFTSNFLKNPEKFIGMHFMNPVPVMKLVEIINGDKTSQETKDLINNIGF